VVHEGEKTDRSTHVGAPECSDPASVCVFGKRTFGRHDMDRQTVRLHPSVYVIPSALLLITI